MGNEHISISQPYSSLVCWKALYLLSQPHPSSLKSYITGRSPPTQRYDPISWKMPPILGEIIQWGCIEKKLQEARRTNVPVTKAEMVTWFT